MFATHWKLLKEEVDNCIVVTEISVVTYSNVLMKLHWLAIDENLDKVVLICACTEQIIK